MSTLKELLDRKAELDREIELTRRQEKSDAIAQVRSLMLEHGLALSDLSTKAAPKPTAGKGAKVAAKYRNEDTGETWSGRGLQPKWLKAAMAAGRKPEDFAL